MATSPSVQVLNLERLIDPTDRQRECLEKIAESDFVLYGGAAGGGKSYLLRWWLVWFLYQLFKFKGLRNVTVALFCEDYPSLHDRQISKIKFEFPAELGRLREGVTKDFTLHDCFGGGTIALRNLDDPSKYQSAEFAAIAVDELTKNDLSMFNFLRMRLRWPGVKRPKFLAGSNPGDIGGDWVKAYWITRKYPKELEPFKDQFAFVQAKSSDNPHLTESYHTWLQSQPEDLRKRFADGDWSVFEGQYFTAYDEESTKWDHDDFLRHWGPQYWQPTWISIDWGSTHHFCVGWHTFVTLPVDQDFIPERVLLPMDESREARQRLIRAELEKTDKSAMPVRNVMVTYREWLDKGLGEEAMAEEIVRRTPIQERPRVNNVFLSPDAGFESELQRGVRIGNVFIMRQMPKARSAYNSRIDGWRLMHDKLRDRIVSKGMVYSGWCVTTQCPRHLEAIPWAVADPDKDGDIIKEGESPLLDVLDEARYGIASYEYAEEKPADQRRKEIIAALPVTGASRFIAHKTFDLEECKTEQPYYTGGLGSRKGRRHGRS
jgi:Terminase large subunit, T4likevirus-type, N-terminal